jgi:hypothetical protein
MAERPVLHDERPQRADARHCCRFGEKQIPLRIEYVASIRPDQFKRHTHEALILFALPDKASQPGVMLLLQNELSRMGQLGERAWRGQSILVKQVSTVVQHPGVKEPGHGIDPSFVRDGLHRPGKKPEAPWP